jgi:hypothetical protein
VCPGLWASTGDASAGDASAGDARRTTLGPSPQGLRVQERQGRNATFSGLRAVS